MTRRRPGAGSNAATLSRRQIAAPISDKSSIGIWYAALIGAVLLAATGVYAAFLHQQVKEWKEAADQLAIGQDLLRADRDEILQKAREREVTLSTLEAAREQDRARLDGLENQRRRLQDEVLRLTQELARNERQANGTLPARGGSAAIDRLERELEAKGREVTRLEDAVAERDRKLESQATELEARIETTADEAADLKAEKAALALDMERLQQQLAERRENERLRQIVRGHRASLGETTPYIAEVGPEDWSVIESWLALQLRRPMAVPDLSDHGLFYEGARLLGSNDGPPMAMLLYADADERPISLTVIKDSRGERPLETGENGGLSLLDWREERHAFFLAGETEEDVLKSVALDLQNQPPRLSEDAPVPVSRYVRPGVRPEAEP